LWERGRLARAANKEIGLGLAMELGKRVAFTCYSLSFSHSQYNTSTAHKLPSTTNRQLALNRSPYRFST
jgi:hypothetical protein